MRPFLPASVDADFASLIRDSWSDDASQRPSAEDVMRRLEEECSGSSAAVKRAREEVVASMLSFFDSYPSNWSEGEVDALFAEGSQFACSDEDASKQFEHMTGPQGAKEYMELLSRCIPGVLTPPRFSSPTNFMHSQGQLVADCNVLLADGEHQHAGYFRG